MRRKLTPYLLQIGDFLCSSLDTVTDILQVCKRHLIVCIYIFKSHFACLQALSLLFDIKTYVVGAICLCLKWVPGIYLFLEEMCCSCKSRTELKNCLIQSWQALLLHPAMLSWYQLRNIWQDIPEQKEQIKKYQIIRGCFESPTSLVIRVSSVLKDHA